MLCIGITGSIGTGKSTVSEYLKDKGFIVIDADIISRKISEKNQPGYYAILEEFGKDILDNDNEIDKKKLSNLVFNDKDKLEALNSTMHPIILNRIIDIKKYYQEKEQIIFIDAALLIETGLYRHMDKIILIHSDKDIQLKRVMMRDGTDSQKVERIIKSQMPYTKKQTYADFIVENNQDIKYLHNQIDRVLETLLKEIDNV